MRRAREVVQEVLELRPRPLIVLGRLGEDVGQEKGRGVLLIGGRSALGLDHVAAVVAAAAIVEIDDVIRVRRERLVG